MTLRWIIPLLVLAVGISAATSAANISIRRSDFGNWQYAKDDTNFVSVGSNCENLRRELSGDSESVGEIDRYNDQIQVSTLLLLAGGSLGAFAAYKEVKDQWESDYWTVVGVGGGLAILSFLVEHGARGHLTRAVTGFNDRQRTGVSRSSAFLFPALLERRTLGIEVGFRF